MAGQAGTVHVLLVVDDPDIAELAGEHLERDGEQFSIATAPSSEEAFNRLEGGRFECIVSDYRLPDDDGIALLVAVRERHPELPFILFTGEGSEEVASRAISAGLTDYVRKGTGSDQLAVLANRIVNAVDQYRTSRRADNLDRINSVVREVNDALVRATAPDDIDQQVCDIIQRADPYRFVWIGEYDDASDRVVHRASAGIERGYVESIDISVEQGPTAQGPTGTAIRTGRIQVMQDIQADPDYEPWRADALERGYRSSAAVPLVHEGTRYGVLNVYAPRADAFDDTERTLLSDLGDTIAHAYHRIDVQRQQSTQFRALFEEAPLMVAFTRRESGRGVIEDCNAKFARTLGYSKDELRGTPIDRIYDDESRRAMEDSNAYRRALAGKFTREQRMLVTRHGERVPTVLRASPRHDEDGRVIGTYGMFIDISYERQLTELEAVKERIEFALDATNSLVFEIDPTTGEEARHGPFERLFGLSSEALPTAEAFYEEAIHPEDRETLERFLTTPSAGRDSRSIEVRTHPDNAPIRWIRTSAFLQEGSDDTHPRLVGLHVDITHQKRREQRLEALNESAQNLIASETREKVAERAVHAASEILSLEATGIHRYHSDERLVPLSATDAFYDLVGEPPTLTAGDSIAWRVFQEGTAATVEDVREQPGRYDADTDIRSELYLPIGEFGIMIAGSIEPYAYDRTDVVLGKILANNVAAAIEQVEGKETLRARERALKQQNERLDEFTSVVSHDLRNPLNIASGRVLLAQGECDSEHLDSAIAAHERMDALIDDLLTLAREGEEIRDWIPVDLADCVTSSWEAVATADASLCIDVDQTIQADPTRLGQLFDNLIRNAIEHGGDGVTVIVGPLDGGFVVEDTGPGIPAANREEVFEAGFSTSANGTGFGLAIIEQVVEAHGWELHLKSGSSGGARFEVSGVDLAD